MVKNQLTRKGVDPARLTPLGLGEGEPIATNATPEGRAQNRRVEIELRPSQRTARAN
jgi:outer membrane protein OmpA-like peptidoglycan-associated protein